jgi:hypothetical protein
MKTLFHKLSHLFFQRKNSAPNETNETNADRWKDGEILTPNELERRQIFYILKRNSSYTAMKQSLDYYQKWADVAKESVREAEEQGLFSKSSLPRSYLREPDRTSIRYETYEEIAGRLALFKEGLRRLGKGDKRVFTYGEYGLFIFADGMASHYLQIPGKVEWGEIGWQAETPYTREFFETLKEYSQTEGGRCICEDWYQHESPRLARMNYSLWSITFLSKQAYPNPLPKVPKPTKKLMVATGETVPFSGIWEPVEKGKIAGAMNYLHGGSLAPFIEQYFRDISDTYGEDSKEVETHWRLIWRDDRYEDGTIPEEEKDYILPCPIPLDTEDQDREEPYLKYLGVPVVAPSILVGDPCPTEGWWGTPTADNAVERRYFVKGEIMPDFPGASDGATSWQWIGSSIKASDYFE